MLALGSAVCMIMRAASLTSNRPRSSPPVTFSSMPLAPSIFSSISGEVIAFLAASSARFSPEPWPTPISAEPAWCMTRRTSAKSRLIRPGIVIRSVMPWTPWRRMSSASRKASRIVVRRSTIWSSFSLGTTISVSTSWRRRSMPSSAAAIRFLPSNSNGLVTAPTVSAPISCLAISAITGAAPVPVPPPSPQVMKTMSAPFSASLMSSRDSAAAPAPTSGLAPGAEALGEVVADPDLDVGVAGLEGLRVGVAGDELDARAGRHRPCGETAFEPPPPTPTTLMTARYEVSIELVLLRFRAGPCAMPPWRSSKVGHSLGACQTPSVPELSSLA